MSWDESILARVRTSVIGIEDNTEFDDELLPFINTAISTLNQNGVGNFLVVEDDKRTWKELMDVTQTEGNKYFQMVPLFVILSTKILFDPPPPSSVEYHSNSIKEILWRLKIAYEE